MSKKRRIHCRNVLVENIWRDERNAETRAPILRISRDAMVENLRIRNLNARFVGHKCDMIVNHGICEPIITEV